MTTTTGPRARTLAVASVLVGAAAVAPSVSRAQTTVIAPIEASVSHWSSPALALNGDDVSRRIVGLPLPSASTFFGVGAGIGMLGHDTIDDPSHVALIANQMWLHARFAWAAADGLQGAANGLPTTVSRGEEYLFELSAPALTGGLVIAQNHLAARLGLDWGWAYLWTRGTAALSGAGTLGGSADAGSLFIHLPLSGCVLFRSFDAKKSVLREGEDVCLTLTPTVYEWAWFNGWSAGIRVDL